MENQYKVELWIDEIKNQLNELNTIKFNHNDENVIHIINDNYNDVFNCLIKGKSIRIANLTFDKNNFYQIYEQEKHILANRITIFTSLEKNVQNEKLASFKKENDDYINKHSTCLYYIAFGFLDYFAIDNKHSALSAPLLFIPIEIIYNESEEFYQIKSLNNEIKFNDQLIDYINKTKKIDISYVVDEKFDLDEYLLYVASKVHMFHYSTNNGVCISKFDIYKQSFLNDIIAHQEEIANHVLVKSIAYYNSEFYNFSKVNDFKLNKKVLSLLSLDNDEYRILKRVSNRESMLIKTNNLQNKTHILNNIILNYILNNKKILVVYDDLKIKNDVYTNLVDQLKPYVFDLNEINANKLDLLNHLNQYDNNNFSFNAYDPIAAQEVLNKYYDTRNNFKKLINEMRKKSETFNLSLNDCIEHYYRLNVPLLDCEIKNISLYDISILEQNINLIVDFENSLRKLKCYYKKHPFYGFSKNVMMQEDYLKIKKSAIGLTKNLNLLEKCLSRLSLKYALPNLMNLKQLKAMLNIFSVLEVYIQYEKYFENNFIDNLKKKLISIENNYQEYISLKDSLKTTYGEKVLLLQDQLIEIYDLKTLSKKDLKKYKDYFNEDINITLDLLKELDAKLRYLEELNNKYNYLRDSLDANIDNCFVDGKFDLTSLNAIEENVKVFNKAYSYLINHSVNLNVENFKQFKNENKFRSLSLLKTRIQILYNRILNYVKTLQEYFNVDIIDYSTLSFDLFINKTTEMSTSFDTINDYLDFYLIRHKIGRKMGYIGEALLKHEDFTLYELMFYKRFYYDYSYYLLKNAKLDNLDANNIYESINTFNISETKREEIIEQLLSNIHRENVKANFSSLKKYEFDFIEKEKQKEFIKPLDRITYLANESIYKMIPCIFIPLKSIAKLLKSKTYHYDACIFLVNNKVKTLDTLNVLHRVDQIIAFDDEYINNSFVEDINTNNSELFLSACYKTYDKVEFVSKTYNVLDFKGNNLNPYFKKYLKKYLEKSGLKVLKDVPFKNGYIDFLVKTSNSNRQTALIIDRLGYYSLESAKRTFDKEDKELKDTYKYIRIFPFSFLLNEEKEKKEIIETIVENALAKEIKNVKVVKKKLTDVLFITYINPYQVYYLNKARFVFDREKLLLEVLNKCAPIDKQTILRIFKEDGIALINNLESAKQIYIKNDFIYLANKEIVFKSYKNKEQIRYITSLSKEEIEQGILQIVKTQNIVSEEDLIKMILISLGYEKMNAKIYAYVQEIILGLVYQRILTMHEKYLSLFEEPIKEDVFKKEEISLKREE